MADSTSFWKSHWGTHFKIWIGVYIIASVAFGIITISLYNLPFKYSMLLSLPWIILYSNVILIGIIVALSISKSIKPLFLILELNDCHYTDKILKSKIPKLIITLPLYLIIFYIYFIAFRIYNPIATLLLSWLVLIIVRSAYYTSPKLGNRIGGFIGAFFLPFGFMALVVNIHIFFKNIPSDMIPVVTFIFYFILVILAQIPLEILMDYISSSDKKKQLKANWKKNPAYVPFKRE